MRFRSKERGTRVKDRAKNGVSKRAGRGPFLARPKPRIPFLGLSLLRNQTETLATQASVGSSSVLTVGPRKSRIDIKPKEKYFQSLRRPEDIVDLS